MIITRKHSHYFKPLPAGATHIDVYRVLEMFGVTDQALGHAIKKLLVAGGRGVKDQRKDIQEAVDTLQRRLEMMDEDEAAGVWLPWNGVGPIPVDGDAVVEVRLRNGAIVSNRRATDAVWAHSGDEDDVVAVKVVLSGC